MINKSIKSKKKNDFPTEFKVDDRYVTDYNVVANAFNSYFANIGKEMAQHIKDPNTSYQYFLSTKTNTKFVYELIDIKQTDSLISSLKNKSSFGYDLISNKLVKLLKPVIVRPLTLIINQMLSTGIFPEAMKMSKVILLLDLGLSFQLNLQLCTYLIT